MNQKALVEITVSPKSSRSKIVVDKDNRIKIYLNSPPVDGKANDECIRLLAKSLGIPKGSVEIERGKTGRKKMIRIEGLSRDEILRRIT